MKKLMIAAAIVCAAAFAQAATIQWGTGNMKNAAGKDGGKGASAIKSYIATGTTLQEFVFLVDETDYGKYSTADQATIYAAFSDKLTEAKADGYASAAANVSNGLSAETAASVGVDQYAVIITTYTDKDYGDMYLAGTAMKAGEDITNPGGTYPLSTLMTGTGAGQPGNVWQAAAVPEPTSAMLLLLGMAGLALRRRRA